MSDVKKPTFRETVEMVHRQLNDAVIAYGDDPDTVGDVRERFYPVMLICGLVGSRVAQGDLDCIEGMEYVYGDAAISTRTQASEALGIEPMDHGNIAELRESLAAIKAKAQARAQMLLVLAGLLGGGGADDATGAD